jgi:pyruvate,orthophosphate dikinase
VILKEGEWVSINGTTGEVIKGQQPVKKPGLTGDLATFMKWVDAKRRLKVLTNADTPEDAKVSWMVIAAGVQIIFWLLDCISSSCLCMHSSHLFPAASVCDQQQ